MLFTLILEEDLPFVFVRKPTFRDFCDCLDYKPFSVPFLMKMVHFVESDLEDVIYLILKDQVALGLIADGWTAKTLHSTWFVVLVSFIDKDMKMGTVALRLHRVRGSFQLYNALIVEAEHTGQSLCDAAVETLEAFDALEKVKSSSTDNASVGSFANHLHSCSEHEEILQPAGGYTRWLLSSQFRSGLE